jgi:hypothetical protein
VIHLAPDVRDTLTIKSKVKSYRISGSLISGNLAFAYPLVLPLSSSSCFPAHPRFIHPNYG